MTLLSIALIAFVILELSNVLALYFKPTMKQANAVGMFKAWDKSKKDPEIHDLVQYLVYWVAGSKLIFITLLSVIIIFGDSTIQFVATLVLILSIATYYWKLNPLIKKMDKSGEIDPKGYSKTLEMMIGGIIVILSIALVVSYLVSN